MTIRNFEYLLSPKTVALIGASASPGSIGRIVAINLRKGGFRGPVWLVNPKRREIDGEPCFNSIASLPAAPDLAVIATPPASIPGIIGELGERGTRAAVVITAGMTSKLRGAMLRAARPYLLRIQGPNCLGLLVPGIGLDASFCHVLPPPGDLALVSQSGALVTAIADWASGRGIGFSHIVSLGDMADADFGDFLDYFAGDIRSRAVLLYIEQVTNAPKFMSAARRAARVKPVIVIKSGRHAEGARAAMSHTGAMAGSDAGYEAAFRRSGLLRVNELEELFEAAEMLARLPRLDGERLAILTNGGGAGVLAADRLADLHGHLATLSPTTLAGLDDVLPPTWSKGNPVDIIGDASPARYESALNVLLQSSDADAVLVINCPTALSSSTEIARSVVMVREHLSKSGNMARPLLANWLGDGAAVEGRKHLMVNGIPTFETPAAAIGGYMQVVRYTRAQDELLRTRPAVAADLGASPEAASEIMTTAASAGREILSETEAKSLLAAYGIPVVPTRIAKSPEEVAVEAQDILANHAACVVKILSHDITHKSDVGGVTLGLSNVAAAREAAQKMQAAIAAKRPAARLSGFTIQPMISRPRAHELLVGMSVDPTFGPMMTFGAGGTAVEILKDTAQALPPLDLTLSRDMIRATRIARLLEGYRDRPPADMNAIAMTLLRLSALVVAHDEILEIDINPLLADETGVIALDARIRIAGAGAANRTPLVIRPYPTAWIRNIALDGFGSVLLRPVKPEDELLYADLIKNVSAEDMRLRFFTPRPDLSHKLIARLTQIDYAREMAFVALAESSGALLGVSRLSADPEYERAEFAVVVRSNLKGKGLGWTLMQHLIAYARKEGLIEIFGSVLHENTVMLKMCAELGFKIEADPDDRSLRRVRLNLAAAPAD